MLNSVDVLKFIASNNRLVNRSLISDVDGAGFTSAQDSQNDRSDNISQTPSYDSSDGEEEVEFTVESRNKR